MDGTIAKQISDLMLEYSAKLNQSVALAQQHCAEEEFEKYRAAVGMVMGLMFTEIMGPIYEEHPALMPASLARD